MDGALTPSTVNDTQVFDLNNQASEPQPEGHTLPAVQSCMACELSMAFTFLSS